MTRADLPPFMILVCATGFFLIALFYPWLSAWLGVERSRPERRLLALVLGAVLLFLWLLWRTNRDI